MLIWFFKITVNIAIECNIFIDNMKFLSYRIYDLIFNDKDAYDIHLNLIETLILSELVVLSFFISNFAKNELYTDTR